MWWQRECPPSAKLLRCHGRYGLWHLSGKMARMKVICDSGCCSRMLIVSYSRHPWWSYASFITITAHRQRDYHQWSKWFFRPIMTIVTSKRPKSIGSMEICSIIVHAFLVIRGKFFFYFYDEKYVCPLPDQCCKKKKKESGTFMTILQPCEDHRHPPEPFNKRGIFEFDLYSAILWFHHELGFLYIFFLC